MSLGSKLSQLADRRWRQFYLQRRVMNPRTRDRIADRIARRRGEPATSATDQDMVSDLRTVGQVHLRPLLTAQQCDELRTYFSGCKVEDGYRGDWPAFLPLDQNRHEACHAAWHDDLDVIRAPYLLDLANDPQVLNVLHQYFGCTPVISFMTAWWSYASQGGAQQAELFHRDVDDWRFVKLFVYLSDVEPDTGPHVYVRGSAAASELLTIGRFEDDRIQDTFGRQSIRYETGKAGTAFLENTFGFHKGLHVQRGHRLAFQAVYSLRPIPYGPKKPLLPFSEVFAGRPELRAVNRVYLS